jgi:hypothetical protein
MSKERLRNEWKYIQTQNLFCGLLARGLITREQFDAADALNAQFCGVNPAIFQ